LIGGLYGGEATDNLGSGDLFTLIRNIYQVATKLVATFDLAEIKRSCWVIKGDDVETDSPCTAVTNFVEPELSNSYIVLKIDRFLPPYHAGRFFTPNDIVPDVIRRTIKLMANTTQDRMLAQTRAEGFMADYVRLDDATYQYLRVAAPEMYADFPKSFVHAILDVYVLCRSKKFLFTVLFDGEADERTLVTLDAEEDCAVYAFKQFGVVDESAVRNQSMEACIEVAKEHNIPVHKVKGKANDFTRKVCGSVRSMSGQLLV